MLTIKDGDLLTCAETGKEFIAGRDPQWGFASNYARDSAGNVFSDEGVDILERRELLERSQPFGCYLSSDGRHVTGWKGNILGTVIDSRPCKLPRYSFTHGKDYRSVRVRDVHGGLWYGRGSPDIFIRLRPCK